MPGNPHERRNPNTARKSHLGFQDVDADAAMLHVEDDEFGAGVSGDLAEPRREEFRRHDAIDDAAFLEFLANVVDVA